MVEEQSRKVSVWFRKVVWQLDVSMNEVCSDRLQENQKMIRAYQAWNFTWPCSGPWCPPLKNAPIEIMILYRKCLLLRASGLAPTRMKFLACILVIERLSCQTNDSFSLKTIYNSSNNWHGKYQNLPGLGLVCCTLISSVMLIFKGTISSWSEQTFNRAWNRCPSLRWTQWLKITGAFMQQQW